MDEDEEDWRQLLEQYLPPPGPHGDPDAGDLAEDDAPWRAALRAAAQQAKSNPDGERIHHPTSERRKPAPHGSDGGTPSPAAPKRDARTGDLVIITTLAGMRGSVVAINGEMALVETASARVRARRAELVVAVAGHEMRGRPHKPSLVLQPGRNLQDRTLNAGRGGGKRRRWHSLDLHGLQPSEALERLDDFLFTCWEEGRETVAVIHGKGAGTLRKAVRAMLAEHPAVRHQHPALPHSGGEGVTIVTLFAPHWLSSEENE